MIKYQTCTYSEAIETVEIERETSSSVWIEGRRHSISSISDKYHDTWEDARTYLLTMAIHKVRNCQSELDRAKAKLSKISKLVK